MFCAPVLVFSGTECVGSRLHVLRIWTRFRRYRWRRVLFSYFARPDSFSAVPRASGPLFISCAPGLVFSGIEDVGFLFHVLRYRTRFYRGRSIPFSCFARPDSFSAVPRASGPVFMFCAPRLIFGVAEGVGSRFRVFCARTRFRGYRGRWVPSSCFALPDSFLTVPRASGPFLMFSAPRLIFGGNEGFGSRFHVLRAQTRFRRYRGCRVPFICFARPDSFSAVPRASGPVFLFCAPGIVFVGSCFHVSWASGPVFMFCAPVLIFDYTDDVGSRFYVLRARTHFRRYRGRRVPFSCFALPDSYSAVRRASGPDLIFCAPGLILGGNEGIVTRFHILRARTRFRRCLRRRVPF
jgi:hypothetical protein